MSILGNHKNAIVRRVDACVRHHGHAAGSIYHNAGDTGVFVLVVFHETREAWASQVSPDQDLSEVLGLVRGVLPTAQKMVWRGFDEIDYEKAVETVNSCPDRVVPRRLVFKILGVGAPDWARIPNHKLEMNLQRFSNKKKRDARIVLIDEGGEPYGEEFSIDEILGTS